MVLPFQRQILEDMLEEDGLLVLGRGLGLHKIVLNFLKLHCVPNNLVFLLNTNPAEQELFIEDLRSEGVSRLPIVVNTDYNAAERTALYLKGGVLFVSSRILIVDMLNKCVPSHLITGFLVNHAQRVSETSMEAFILRLFRQSNKTGFIKAFSESPEAFASGFCKVEAIMKNLYVKRLYLWPRFHLTVAESLEKHQPEVIELEQPLTDTMQQIQEAIVKVMEACLQELRSTNQLDIEELTVENGLFKSFDTIIRNQLSPIWHNTGPKTKQLVADLRTLRNLLDFLVSYDCVSYNRYLETLSSHRFGPHSGWLFMNATSTIFKLAKNRVYKTKRAKPPKKRQHGGQPKRQQKKIKSTDKENNNNQDTEVGTEAKEKDKEEDNEKQEIRYELVLEENPKWQLLSEILDEIEQENQKRTTGEPGRILIAVKDDRTCAQLQEYLTCGGRPMLERLFKSDWLRKKFYSYAQQPFVAGGGGNGASTSYYGGKRTNRRRRSSAGWSSTTTGQQKKTEATGSATTSPSASLEDFFPSSTHENEGSNSSRFHAKKTKRSTSPQSFASASYRFNLESLQDRFYAQEPCQTSVAATEGEFDFFDGIFGVLEMPHIVVHPLSADCHRLLDDLRPKFVVVYDPDTRFIRQLEVYKADNPGVPLRVYFMRYAKSVEEQKYLSSLRKEKEAFERLIREKATMAIPEDQDGKSEGLRAADLYDQDPQSTRKGGRKLIPSSKGKILVDNREFRSALPSFLDKRGFEVIPCHLEVGDYILSPDVCVERKSISDLFGSMSSGRLYNQVEAMCRRFKIFAVLIEFDQEEAFGLQSEQDIGQEISPTSISSKLVLLTLHFPQLRFLWCRSPQASAELFEALKVPFFTSLSNSLLSSLPSPSSRLHGTEPSITTF
ncbi:DNA repair endonuclease XPF, variant 2 [Balamuthia mandrillaris]